MLEMKKHLSISLVMQSLLIIKRKSFDAVICWLIKPKSNNTDCT